MHRRNLLEVTLGGLFGALLGGIVTVSLVFGGVVHWLIYTPMILGAAAGVWKGDRALLLIMRLVGSVLV